MADATILYRTKTDALLPRDASSIVRRPRPEAVSHARKPLGLAIVDGPDDRDNGEYLGPHLTAQKLVQTSLDHLPPEAWERPATMRDLFELGIGMTLETSFEDGDAIRERLRDMRREATDAQNALRAEIAELKLALTEARGEVSAMRAVQENARIASRGEQGLAGPRGIPGPQGPAGARGEKGEAGAKAAGFVLDVAGYAATLVSSDGAPAARLALRPMFEAFAAEIASEDDE